MHPTKQRCTQGKITSNRTKNHNEAPRIQREKAPNFAKKTRNAQNRRKTARSTNQTRVTDVDECQLKIGKQRSPLSKRHVVENISDNMEPTLSMKDKTRNCYQ
ncbi:hypothetical protein L1887_39522 [Cichorium endivia]|nr:hypothetical protein L1887_39522 [Cichorium endivia]